MSGTEGMRGVRALFLSPHPDDVELFCGGTVARLTASGCTVGILDLTAGERASNGSARLRREESLAAAAALGVRHPRRVLGLPDGGLDAESTEQLERLRRVLVQESPELVFAPYPQDRHPDHVAAGLLARRVAREQERAESFVLYEYPCHHPAPPRILVDVGAQMEARRAAIAAYRSQFVRVTESVPTPINEPDFLERIEARLREWGARAGVEFAEGFLGRALPAVDPLQSILEGVRHG